MEWISCSGSLPFMLVQPFMLQSNLWPLVMPMTWPVQSKCEIAECSKGKDKQRFKREWKDYRKLKIFLCALISFLNNEWPLTIDVFCEPLIYWIRLKTKFFGYTLFYLIIQKVLLYWILVYLLDQNTSIKKTLSQDWDQYIVTFI